LGFTPKEVDGMSLFEFTSCVEGYAKAHGAKPSAKDISAKDYEALVALGEKWNQEALSNG
jgi:hypothetical protein